MNTKELFQMIETDFKIDYDNLKDKLFLVPSLHSKYLRMYFQEKKKYIECSKKLKTMYKEKWYHYSKDYNFSLSSKEIELYIQGDEEYNNLLTNCEKQKELVKVFDETVGKAKNLSFDIKNIISYLEYMNGGV